MKQLFRIVLTVIFILLSKDLVGQSHGWTVNPADYGNTGTITAIVYHGTVGVSTGTLGAFVGGTCRGFINCSLFGPTGKYVFVLTVYSNAASGETLTFRYFDPSGNTFYDINETEVFSSDMILGDAMSPVQFHTQPLIYSVTGGGSYCQGLPGLPVGLSNSETGVTYTLLKNGAAQTPTVAGTGSAISFGNQLGGTYTVTGTNSGGTTTMTGNAVIVENPLPLVPVANPGSGATCVQISANWSSASYATSYALDASTVNNFATYLTGYQNINVGNVTTYPVSGLSPGTLYYYRVRAVNSCGTSASSSVISYSTSPAAPAQPGTITGTAAQCPALTGQTYSITSVTNATTYAWTVPTGWSITAGQGTTSVSVTTGSAGQNGNITVTAGNSCGTSTPGSLAVTVSTGTPAVPGVITGTTTVCPGLTGQIYSIGSVTNATTYTWTVPTGWSITAGQGTTSLTVTSGSAGQNGNITVTAGNSCGTSAANSLAVIVSPGTPAVPGAITGTTTVCPGLTGQIYSIGNVTNATTYTWAVPSGWSITAGQGTTSLTVTSGSAGQNGNITVTAGNSCGTSTANSLAVTVSQGTPAVPGAITGITTVCPGLTGQIYSISSVTNATTYTWTVPTGWSITAGQGTTSLTVTSGSAGQNGNITVTAGNSCATSTANSLAVTVSPGTPAVPGAITGITTVCPGLTGQIYSISSVTNATTYTWTVPTGWSITAGQGTTSVTVTSGSAGQNGNITVTAGNSCGTSTANSLAVTVSPGTPAVPGAITGTTTVCPGLTGQIYTIGSVTNATTYTWTVPTGWSITTGQGTTSVTVTSGSAGQNGNISVTAGNSCGTSTANSLAATVSQGTPAVPGAITGTTTVCPGLTGQIYSISSVTNATTYTWTVPTGWSITAGQGTTSVTVTTGSTGQNGNIAVTAGNTCGTSGPKTLALTVNAIPTITGQLSVCMGSTTNLTGSGTPAASNPWTSASPLVAQVSGTGLVTAVSQGTSIITYTDNFGCRNNATVTVNSLPVISGTLSIFLGSSTQLTGSGIPAISSPWTSSTPTVATVSSTGLVNSTGAGTSVITYTDINGCSSTATITIRLVDLNKPLTAGWNWFSVNTLLSNMTLPGILPSVNSDGDYIKNQISSATYYSGFGWFGSLTEIDPTRLYKIKIQNSTSISYSGAPVNVNLTSIALVTGWNWIGYLPQASQPVSNALSSLSLSEGDYIKNQTASTTYYSSVGWFGSLNQLSPYDGYMIKIANPGTLKYSEGSSKNVLAISGDAGKTLLNPAEFEYSGSVTAKVLLDGENTGSANDTLFTYINSQLRGYSTSYFFEPLGIYLFPIMTFSNAGDGENIEFRYYNASGNKLYTCKENLPFVKDMIVADAFHPFVLNVNSDLTYNTELNLKNDLNLKAYPNPFKHFLKIEFSVREQSHVQLIICNSSGIIIKELINNELSPEDYSINWDSSMFPEGLYIIKLQAGSNQEIQKVTLVK